MTTPRHELVMVRLCNDEQAVELLSDEALQMAALERAMRRHGNRWLVTVRCSELPNRGA